MDRVFLIERAGRPVLTIWAQTLSMKLPTPLGWPILIPLLLFVWSTGAQSTVPPPADGNWRKLQLTTEFWAEGSTTGDVNKDGAIDILCGPFWYEGPSFQTRHEIHPATARYTNGTEKVALGFPGALSGRNGYSDNFLSFSSDLNHDGWLDYIVVGHPGKETHWYENPRGRKQRWTRHLAFAHTDNESPQFLEFTSKGAPELLCMSQGALGFARPDPARPQQPWSWHPVARNAQWQWNTHGLGFGDVNGDGRVDLLTAHNWWEQPPSLEGNPAWRKHDAVFNNGGSHMFAYDVNGDGRSDVITAHEGHGYGLHWFEQTGLPGEVTWKRHVITGKTPAESETGIVFSQPHALALVDMNGDGLKDIVTGKRFWAHGPEGDSEPNAPAVLYWFELQRKQGQARYVAHLINADSGVGTQVTVADVNGDGKPDVVVGNKKGLSVHLQR